MDVEEETNGLPQRHRGREEEEEETAVLAEGAENAEVEKKQGLPQGASWRETQIRRMKMGRSYRQRYPWNLQSSGVLLSGTLWVAPILMSSSLTDWFGIAMGLRRGEDVVQERSPYERSGGDPIMVRHTLWQSSGEAILPFWTIAAVLTVVANLIPLIVYRSRWRRFRLLGLCCGRCDGKLNLNNVARYDEVFLCDDCAKQMEDMEKVGLTRFAIIAPKIAPPPNS